MKHYFPTYIWDYYRGGWVLKPYEEVKQEPITITVNINITIHFAG